MSIDAQLSSVITTGRLSGGIGLGPCLQNQVPRHLYTLFQKQDEAELHAKAMLAQQCRSKHLPIDHNPIQRIYTHAVLGVLGMAAAKINSKGL